MKSPQTSITVVAVAAILVPQLKSLGVTLTPDQAVALVVLVLSAWHGVVHTIERYLPLPPPKTERTS
jgi:hypothetical protein